jgi:plasmid replication initiation protein
MSISEKKLVVQHNNIVEAKYRLSISEQRLIKYLVALIERDDEDFKSYRIAVADLARILDIKRKDYYQSVKNTTKKLVTKLLTFKSSGLTTQAAWLASAVYHDGEGFVELQFAPVLKPFLLQLKVEFTKYELGNVIHLKRTYSMRIYELLKQFEGVGKRKFEIQNLRSILGILENEYQQFCDFRRWILKTAQQELAEKTDIAFTWEEEKKAQKCIAITFTITKQNRLQLTEEKEQRLIFEKVPVIEVKTDPPVNESVKRLVAMGVTCSTAEEIAAEYAIDRIERAIAYTQDKQQEGGVKNPAAFVVTAIKKDFTDALAEEKRKKAQAQQERRKIAQEKKAADEKAKQEVSEKYRKAFETFQALSKTEQATIKNEFIETTDSTTAESIRRAKNQGKDMFASPLIFSNFKVFLVERKVF